MSDPQETATAHDENQVTSAHNQQETAAAHEPIHVTADHNHQKTTAAHELNHVTMDNEETATATHNQNHVTPDQQETTVVHEPNPVTPDHLFSSEPQLKDVVAISSEEFENALEDALVCPVCYLPYNSQKRRPKMLACGHTFCLFCISQIQKKDLFTFSLFHHISVTCPVCRGKHTYDSQKDIPLNRVVEDLIRIGKTSEKNDNKASTDEVREGQSSNNTISMTRKGTLFFTLFVVLLTYCCYLWNQNNSLQNNFDIVSNKFSSDLDIVHAKLRICMYMNNAEHQLGCLKDTFGRITNNINEKVNVKEEKQITDQKKYPKKSQVMDVFMKKDYAPRKSHSQEKENLYIPKDEDFFYKLSKSFTAESTNNENFFELMMSLDFTSPGQSGLWLWLEKGLTWMLQYFFLAHCIRYLCLYWWLRIGALILAGYLGWKTAKGIQAAFPAVSGAGGSILLLSMFSYMVYYVVSGDNWISAWLSSELAFVVVQTNSLGGTIFYGLAFLLSMVVVLVIWFMDVGNRPNAVPVNAEVAAEAAVEAALAVDVEINAEVAAEAAVEAALAVDIVQEPTGQQDVPHDLVAAEARRKYDAPTDIAAVAVTEEQDATDIDSTPKTQPNTKETNVDKENKTIQNVSKFKIATDVKECAQAVTDKTAE
ncbi:unnamed protein product [Meganyctiphanes norvegica]|uniref:RING-type domain-containing protein n=1 Tax=Meganyctiphanes norvegica TaxID=48144 RepID=A0AAV2PK70_MEGNR